ncbi:MAG: c-type cytochrome biogenesis protein CcmI [Lamprocystis purpurea]|jgi:cytochrome c-type biogenesis protein CcmH|uniref:c-type cytochrome biogenesis protein CcmI n=1 Tax=Lamprocystis purpurea TaxID=61598 RepID=UPI00036A9A9F|nr:c-type cytochrome biogenesis protein CcmI [Lamprocystis purpurea]MBV5275536.1 c-type cytochrome biogenesis protein CcmI [Lamprocystis purpurea]
MIIFWILAAGLTGLAILFIARPLLSGLASDPSPSQSELNLQIARSRLAELDADLAAGVLDQGQSAAARKDLERELLSDLHDCELQGDQAPGSPRSTGARTPDERAHADRAPWLALVLILAVPTAAVLTYLELGDRAIIPRIENAVVAAVAPTAEHVVGPEGQSLPSLDTLAQGLAERMQQNPDNLEGWLMLGRTYVAIDQPAKALEAMERAFQLAPDDAGVMVGYAEALAANSGNQLDGQPAELIQAALEREPDNASARWLSGMLAFQQARFAEAAATWQGILTELDPAGEDAVQMREMITEARRRGGLPEAQSGAQSSAAPGGSGISPALPPEAPAAAAAQAQVSQADPAQDTQASAASQGPRIQVSVNLAPELAAQVNPTDTLFIYARAAAGPPMPLAVSRVTAADLPATVTLDDSSAVVPAMRLSSFPQVIVGARISKSGQATPGQGDLEGQVGPLATATPQSVAVTIDRVRP